MDIIDRAVIIYLSILHWSHTNKNHTTSVFSAITVRVMWDDYRSVAAAESALISVISTADNCIYRSAVKLSTGSTYNHGEGPYNGLLLIESAY